MTRTMRKYHTDQLGAIPGSAAIQAAEKPEFFEGDGLRRVCENSVLSPEGTAEPSPGRESWVDISNPTSPVRDG